MQTGDPYLRVIVENILCWVALPIHAQLMAWIFDGELDDTFHEFFVASDPQVGRVAGAVMVVVFILTTPLLFTILSIVLLNLVSHQVQPERNGRCPHLNCCL